MSQAQNYKQFAILYVDDEEVSLKYFRKAFEKDFRVLTALSVDEACAIIDKDGADIGIVITDQRMPGRTGVDLLNYIRQRRPGTIRMLTTAYSDLNSAIQAVNTGAIYKYVVKPWDINDLQLTLLRAMDYFVLQRERDSLLREKLSVLQRIIIADRVRSLAVLAAGLAHHIRNSMTALTMFLELTPMNLHKDGASNPQPPEYWSDLLIMARRESERILRIVHDVSQSTIEPDYHFNDLVAPDALAQSISKLGLDAGVSVSSKVQEKLPPVQLNRSMFERCFKILLERMAKYAGGKACALEISSEAVGNSPGLSIRLSGTGAPWDKEQVAALFTAFAPNDDAPEDLGVDLLSAFFVIHHHGGYIAVNPDAPGFVVTLPLDPKANIRSSLEIDCLEKLFARLERESQYS